MSGGRAGETIAHHRRVDSEGIEELGRWIGPVERQQGREEVPRVEPTRPARVGLVDGALDHRARARAEREQTPGWRSRGLPAEGSDPHTDGRECGEVEGVRSPWAIRQGQAGGSTREGLSADSQAAASSTVANVWVSTRSR